MTKIIWDHVKKQEVRDKFRRRYFCAAILCLEYWTAPLAAQTLPELWKLVTTSEPAILAAQAQAQATAERENQTFSQFLPQVNVTANTTNNNRRYETTGAFPNISQDRYNSNGSQINITQSLWKRANHVAHSQAQAATEQSRLQLLATQQDLLSKLVSYWAEVAFAKDALQTSIAMEVVAMQQLNSYERGFSLGLYAVNQRDEARAKQQRARSERYAAEAELFSRHTILEQLVGKLPSLGTTATKFGLNKIPFETLKPLDAFTGSINTTNPNVKAAVQALIVANEEVRKQQAQHGATLDLVAGIGRNSQLSTGAIPSQSGFKSRLDTVALQLNLPIYSGGSQNSKVREAVALAAKAEYELDSAKRNAVSQASQAWVQLRTAQAKFEAAEQSLIAGESAERVAILGQKIGTKTPMDESQAKQQIETARRDSRRAYYDYLIGMAKLLAASGSIEEATLDDFERRLIRAPIIDEIKNTGDYLKLTP